MASKAQEVAVMRNGDYQFGGSADDPWGPASSSAHKSRFTLFSPENMTLPYRLSDPQSPDQRD